MNSLLQIIENLKQKQLKVFCGAGISYNSGLPIVPVLLKYLFTKLRLTKTQSRLLHESKMPFESIMQTVFDESGPDEIQEIFGIGEPNTNHLFLAKLAKHGDLKLICTPNFDTLIEQALIQEGMVPEKDFLVYTNHDTFKSINWNSEKILLIKIHGCVTDKKSMAITLKMLASTKYSDSRKSIIEAFFGESYCNSLLIMGYSCSDIDLVPLIKSVEKKATNVVFINHINDHSPSAINIEDINYKTNNNPFQGYRGLQITANTDYLIEQFWKKLIKDDYKFIGGGVTKWQQNLDRWHIASERISGRGINHHIASRLMYDIGHFEEAIKQSKQAISIAAVSRVKKLYAASLGNLGMSYNALGYHEEAVRCLSESIPLCVQIGHTQGLGAQFQALGNTHHNMGNHQAAVQAHLQAMHYAELDNDAECLCNALGNIANAYHGLSELDKARACLDQGLPLAKELGMIETEGSQLGILGVNFILRKQYSEALRYTNEAIAIKESIGDSRGIALLKLNRSGIYHMLNRNSEASDDLDDCIAIARKISNTDLEYKAAIQKAIIL